MMQKLGLLAVLAMLGLASAGCKSSCATYKACCEDDCSKKGGSAATCDANCKGIDTYTADLCKLALETAQSEGRCQ